MIQKTKAKIGTRGSELALAQTRKVLSKLTQARPDLEFELRVIKTRGDHNVKGALHEVIEGGQGIFTREIEQALLDGAIDLACHSAKDLPTRLAPPLAIGAVLEREEARDAWIARDGRLLSEVREGTRVGTSSLRRRAMLLKKRPGLLIQEIRGNVPTRLERLRRGEVDGLVLAACGLARLGLESEITEILDETWMLPAVGQGVIAVEIRGDDAFAAELARSVNHASSFFALQAERSLLALLEGGCQVPIGVSTLVKDGKLFMRAAIVSTDGKRSVFSEHEGEVEEATQTGEELARLLREGGGAGILNEIRKAKPVPIPPH
jgi:hydroxymethylbilane synthase